MHKLLPPLCLFVALVCVITGFALLSLPSPEPGMELHTVDGTLCVRQLGDGPEVRSFNLIVADFHSYFVGQARVLSHDNTVRKATNAIVPGLLDQ